LRAINKKNELAKAGEMKTIRREAGIRHHCEQTPSKHCKQYLIKIKTEKLNVN
jgi:hypothetical protein